MLIPMICLVRWLTVILSASKPNGKSFCFNKIFYFEGRISAKFKNYNFFYYILKKIYI